MSTATIDITPVEDLEGMLEGTPPCEAERDYVLCHRPSAARVTVTCPYCGTTRVFLCAACLSALAVGWAACLHCRSLLDWSGT